MSSRLGAIFTEEEETEDDNSALKYTAPKEPSKRKKKPTKQSKAKSEDPSEDQDGEERVSDVASAAVEVNEPESPSTSTKSSELEQKPGESKVLASATVRLYTINTVTGGYEACADGQVMGCVVIGSGAKYVLLVYDGQQKHWSCTPVTPKFTYNISSLYISFHGTVLVPSEQQQVPLSLHFLAKDEMTRMLRALMTVRVQAGQHATTTGAEFMDHPICGLVDWAGDVLDQSLPTLTEGSLAGILYSVWEVPASHVYANEVLVSTPLLSLSEEKEKIKLKVEQETEEPLGGLGLALVGYREGDVALIGIPTGRTYEGNADITARARPDSWMLVEVRVIKTKTKSLSKEKKKDKEKEKEKERPVSTRVPFSAGDTKTETRMKVKAQSPEDTKKLALKERMARIAIQSGGAGGALAAALNNGVNPMLGSAEKSERPRTNSYTYEEPETNQNQNQEEQKNDFSYHDVYPSSDGNFETESEPQSELEAEPVAQVQAKAIVAGDTTPVFESTTTATPKPVPVPVVPQRRNSRRPSVEPTNKSMEVPSDAVINTESSSVAYYTSPAASIDLSGLLSETAAEKHFIQMQTALSSLQISVAQLQGKIDSVAASSGGGMQAWQVQQIMQSMGMGMNMNMAMQPQQQKQEVLSPPPRALISSSSTNSDNDKDVSYTGAVETIQDLLGEYRDMKEALRDAEAKIQSHSQMQSNMVASSQPDPKVQEALDKARERLDKLQERNDRLVDEKTGLLEKQSGLLERISDGQDKMDVLRKQIDTIRSESKDKVSNVLGDVFVLMQNAFEEQEFGDAALDIIKTVLKDAKSQHT